MQAGPSFISLPINSGLPHPSDTLNRPSPSPLHRLTSPTVVHVKSGLEIQHAGITIPPDVFNGSQLLLELLQGEGSFMIGVPDTLFRTWLSFVGAKTPVPNSLLTLFQCLEVSLIVRHAAAAVRATGLAADAIRRAHRQDMLSADHSQRPRDASAPDGAVTEVFPSRVPAGPGPRLQAAVASVPPPSVPAAAAVVPHLTLCEALLLPSPLPQAAIEHFRSRAGGVLDLSPPRVPVYSPASLHNIAAVLAPLLALCPAFDSLHIPAPALAVSAEPIAALASQLSRLSCLVITHGEVTYTDLATAPTLNPATVAAVLHHLSPAKLRHLSIDAVVDPNAEPLHSALCSFTGLTSLRLRRAPRALQHMPALLSLFLTDLTPAPDAPPAPGAGALVHVPPSVCHVHVTGEGGCVECVHDAVADRFRDTVGPAVAGGAQLAALKVAPVDNRVGAVASASDGSMQSPEEAVHCCGFPYALGAVSLQHGSMGHSAASTIVRFFPYQVISAAWGSSTPRESGPMQAESTPTEKSSCGSAAEGLKALALAVDTHAVPEELKVLALRLLIGEVPHALRVLCVLCRCDLPPRSALCCGAMGSLRTPFEGDLSKSDAWVTARPSGVAHPLCALEMLHYNSAPRWRTPAADAPGVWPCDPEGPGLHTLRLSHTAFILLQDLVWVRASCCMALQDLSVLSTEGPQAKPEPRLNLACISRLTNLCTLSLKGVPNVFSASRGSRLPPSLTALLLHGYDSIQPKEHVAGFGVAMMQLTQLQCLDVVAIVCTPQGSPPSRETLHEVRAAFFAGMDVLLEWLPLHLGTRVSFSTMEQPCAAESRGLSTPSHVGETNVDNTLCDRLWLEQGDSQRR